MYSVSRQAHAKHGSVVAVEYDLNGSELTPFRAVQRACKERRLWLEEGATKVRILISEQVMSVKQAECWAHEEYKLLPKCPNCGKIMNEEVFNNQLSEDLFCSQSCADLDYNSRIEAQKDEEEIDYL